MGWIIVVDQAGQRSLGQKQEVGPCGHSIEGHSLDGCQIRVQIRRQSGDEQDGSCALWFHVLRRV